MIGFLIRILVLCSVVFAVVYAFTRAKRSRVQQAQVRRLEEEIRQLRAAVDSRSVDAEDFAVRSDRIRRAAEHLGVDVSDLPARLPRPKDGEG
jgi:hypothetical protein